MRGATLSNVVNGEILINEVCFSTTTSHAHNPLVRGREARIADGPTSARAGKQRREVMVGAFGGEKTQGRLR